MWLVNFIHTCTTISIVISFILGFLIGYRMKQEGRKVDEEDLRQIAREEALRVLKDYPDD